VPLSADRMLSHFSSVWSSFPFWRKRIRHYRDPHTGCLHCHCPRGWQLFRGRAGGSLRSQSI